MSQPAHPKPVTFVLDNNFIGMLGMDLVPGVANLHLWHLFQEVLRLDCVNAVIVPRSIYTMELQGRYFDPDRQFYAERYLKTSESNRTMRRRSAAFLRTLGSLVPTKDLQAMLDAPCMPTKVIISETEFEFDRDPELGRIMKIPAALDRNKELQTHRFVRGDRGEETICRTVRALRFPGSVVVLSDDKRAFHELESAYSITHIDGLPPPVPIASYTVLNFFAALLGDEKNARYLEARLRDTHPLIPKDLRIDLPYLVSQLQRHNQQEFTWQMEEYAKAKEKDPNTTRKMPYDGGIPRGQKLDFKGHAANSGHIFHLADAFKRDIDYLVQHPYERYPRMSLITPGYFRQVIHYNADMGRT